MIDSRLLLTALFGISGTKIISGIVKITIQAAANRKITRMFSAPSSVGYSG